MRRKKITMTRLAYEYPTDRSKIQALLTKPHADERTLERLVRKYGFLEPYISDAWSYREKRRAEEIVVE